MSETVREEGKRRRWPHITRDTILFGLGIYFAWNEVVLRHSPTERPMTLVFIAGLLGLPIIIRSDMLREAIKSRNGNGGKD